MLFPSKCFHSSNSKKNNLSASNFSHDLCFLICLVIYYCNLSFKKMCIVRIFFLYLSIVNYCNLGFENESNFLDLFLGQARNFSPIYFQSFVRPRFWGIRGANFSASDFCSSFPPKRKKKSSNM